MNFRRKIASILLAVGLLIPAATMSAPSAFALTTSCGHATARIVWSGRNGNMGALYGGKFDFTAYACWNGQDSWLDAPTYAFVNRYGYVSYKYSTSQWASGSDTHYRVVARYAFANGSVCIQTTNDIVVNRNGVFSADTSEQGYSCYVSTVLENGYYGIRNYSYVE